jgi:hypothetical protein
MSLAFATISHNYWERAKRSENFITGFLYEDLAWTIQRLSIRYSIRSSKFMRRYWDLRKKTKRSIDEYAENLGYSVKLESIR